MSREFISRINYYISTIVKILVLLSYEHWSTLVKRTMLFHSILLLMIFIFLSCMLDILDLATSQDRPKRLLFPAMVSKSMVIGPELSAWDEQIDVKSKINKDNFKKCGQDNVKSKTRSKDIKQRREKKKRRKKKSFHVEGIDT